MVCVCDNRGDSRLDRLAFSGRLDLEKTDSIQLMNYAIWLNNANSLLKIGRLFAVTDQGLEP